MILHCKAILGRGQFGLIYTQQYELFELCLFTRKMKTLLSLGILERVLPELFIISAEFRIFIKTKHVLLTDANSFHYNMYRKIYPLFCTEQPGCTIICSLIGIPHWLLQQTQLFCIIMFSNAA